MAVVGTSLIFTTYWVRIILSGRGGAGTPPTGGVYFD
jgi:hypothetical protein